jgi:abhydrolase domain-containing protein 13
MQSGVLDEVVPQRHMVRLWEEAKLRHEKGGGESGREAEAGTESTPSTSGNKDQFREYSWGYHPNTCHQRGYWSAVKDFLNTLELQ